MKLNKYFSFQGASPWTPDVVYSTIFIHSWKLCTLEENSYQHPSFLLRDIQSKECGNEHHLAQSMPQANQWADVCTGWDELHRFFQSCWKLCRVRSSVCKFSSLQPSPEDTVLSGRRASLGLSQAQTKLKFLSYIVGNFPKGLPNLGMTSHKPQFCKVGFTSFKNSTSDVRTTRRARGISGAVTIMLADFEGS